jgi:putative ABC transport system ATP-binding protein
MSEPLLRLEHVTKTFERGRVVALDGVDLEVARGEFVAVVGPSGSGKTTLLHLMGAMDTPSTGSVFVDGVPLDDPRRLESVRATKVGFVFQMHNLIPVLTAAENVEVPLVPRRMPRSERRRRALELLDLVGLGRFARTNVRLLSGGERQRVAVARALANDPPLLLADEPTGNLDSATGRSVMEALHLLRSRSGAALVLVTHNEELCKGADKLVRIQDGRVQQY